MIIKKFSVSKIEKELMDINKDYNMKSTVAVQVVVNNLLIYNTLLEKYLNGDEKNIYLLYQMSSTIFKQLKEYNLLPSSLPTEKEEVNEYQFDIFKKNISSKPVTNKKIK
jgi:hypothetical protein